MVLNPFLASYHWMRIDDCQSVLKGAIFNDYECSYGESRVRNLEGMKISRIEQFHPLRRVRLVKITTDTGIVGWGETTLEGKPQSTRAAVDELVDYLIGKDPRRIEHHWQHIYRSAFYRGGNVLMTALSGIDQALWDIVGKHFDVPVYELLGGAVRDRLWVYTHWGIRSNSDEDLAVARERLDRLQKNGYTCFKTGLGGTWRGLRASRGHRRVHKARLHDAGMGRQLMSNSVSIFMAS